MRNNEAYLETLGELRQAFPKKNLITFTEAAKWLGLSRSDEIRETADFPRVKLKNRELVPVVAMAVYLTSRGRTS